jgi:hypothetical protein
MLSAPRSVLIGVEEPVNKFDPGYLDHPHSKRRGGIAALGARFLEFFS